MVTQTDSKVGAVTDEVTSQYSVYAGCYCYFDQPVAKRMKASCLTCVFSRDTFICFHTEVSVSESL
jgi:hypothetical protein